MPEQDAPTGPEQGPVHEQGRDHESLEDIVRVPEFDELFDMVHEYNHRFDAGAVMMRSLSGHMRRGENPNEPERSGVEREEDVREMHGAVLEVTHQTSLRRLGLSLEPVSGKKGAVFSPEGKIGIGEMRMNLRDGSKLLSFMENLAPGDLQDENFRGNLTELAGMLTNQLADQYDLSSPSDEALELLGSLGRLEAEYQRMGLGEDPAIQRLTAYAHHTKQRTLREYMAIEKGGLMQEPGVGFGPAEWQKDASPEWLSEKWVGAIDTLNLLRQNDRASRLYLQTKERLQRCVDLAQQDLSAIEYYDGARKQELAEVLAAAKRGLEEADSEGD